MDKIPLCNIVRRKVNLNECESSIEYSNLRKDGRATVSIRKRCHMYLPFRLKISLMVRSIRKRDLGMRIDSFFPNGGTTFNKPYELMRKGVGSFVLNELIEDAKKLNSQFLYIRTGQREMKSFLKKNHFKKSFLKNCYFKILN